MCRSRGRVSCFFPAGTQRWNNIEFQRRVPLVFIGKYCINSLTA